MPYISKCCNALVTGMEVDANLSQPPGCSKCGDRCEYTWRDEPKQKVGNEVLLDRYDYVANHDARGRIIEDIFIKKDGSEMIIKFHYGDYMKFNLEPGTYAILDKSD